MPSNNTDFPNNNPNTIQLHVTSAKKNVIGDYHVTGEIVNAGNDTIQSVKVTVHMYDGSNRLIEESTCCYTIPTNIDPGHSPKVSNIFSYIVIIMQRSLKFGFIGGGCAVVVVLFLLFSVFAVATQNYAMDIDPIKDNQNLFNTARVTLTNTGKMPLTNIVVNYGGMGSKAIERLALLSPGEKVLLSPPENSPLQSVTVSADHGLSLTKAYRSPFKIPGMMGS